MSTSNPPFHSCASCGIPIPAGTPSSLCTPCRAAGTATATHRPAALPTKSPKPKPPVASTVPTPQVDFPTFVQALRTLNILSDDDLDRLAADALGDPMRLARRLIRADRLTPYQAGAALQGKARGLLIGSYLVLDKIAVGGMGVVFKALHQPSRRLVALKILPPSFAQDDDAVRRFHREFAIASRLSHPNIVAAIEAGEDRGVHFLTMDYIDGHDLNRLVADGGPLQLRLALHCAIQAARGLEAAHAQSVVHRDIKPGNLMIDAAGELRILDLGIARVIEATAQFGRNADHTLTQTGTYMGTVDFLAPEQADNAKAADHRADIYSLGCTLYFLLKGQPPFPAESLLKRLIAHQTRPAPSLRDARPEVPHALEDIYLRMVAKRPADRPQSMTEVLLELENCRSNPREAGDASTELKSFARTVIKRGVKRAPDTSVFARENNASSNELAFDPNLNLEDLITDFREEARPQPLTEDKLPPRPPRLKTAGTRRRSKRTRRSSASGPLAFACVGLAALLYFLWPGSQPNESENTSNSPSLLVIGSASPLSLFDGTSLDGWEPLFSEDKDWRIEENTVVSQGRDVVNMSLFTTQAFEDFVLECQYRVEPDTNAGILLGDFSPDGQLKRYLEFNLAGSNQQGRYRNGDVFFTRPNSTTYIYFTRSPPNIHNPDGQWNDLTLEARTGQLYCSVNGHRFDFPEPIYLDKPRRIGFQSYKGQFAFRDVKITERPVTPLSERPARILLADDFAVARSGWPQMPESKRAEKPGYDYGYDTTTPGVWYASTERPSWYSWTIASGPLPAFDADIFTRVVPVSPTSRGSAIIHLFAKGDTPGADDTKTRGFQIRIDEQARLFLEPSTWTAKNFPEGPWFGPVTHPAIKPAGQFNKLTLRLRETTLEILVNGQKVVDPIAFNFTLPPLGLHFGVSSDKGPIRAEFDRVLFRALTPGIPPFSNLY